MKYKRSITVTNVLAAAALAAASLGSVQAFGDTNRICAPGEPSNCYLVGNFPPEIAQGFGITDEDSMVVRFIDGEWSMGGHVIGSFGAAGLTPVVGDWDGDGQDNIGVYINGTWILKKSWNFINPVDDVLRYFAFGGPNWIPTVGDWTNDGLDTLGVYKDGTFKIRKDSNNPASENVIDFGVLPYDETVESSFKPVVGSFDDLADRVGIVGDSKAFYSTSNDSGIRDILTPGAPDIIGGSVPAEATGLFPIVVDAYDPNNTNIVGPRLMFSMIPETGYTYRNSTNCEGFWLVTSAQICNPENNGSTHDPDPIEF